MKRRIEIGLIAAAAVAGAVWLILSGGPERPSRVDPSLTGGAVTLRNVTRSRIRYRVKPANAYGEPERRVIRPGEIHRFETEAALDVSLDRVDGEVSRRLEPGHPYSFRYDEKQLVQIYAGSHGRDDAFDLAPYVTTPMDVVEHMLELAGVEASDRIYDIGCGDGRIVIAAARIYGARGVGIDIDPDRIRESRKAAEEAGVEDRVTFHLGDALRMDISDATVVTLYLLPESNDLLRPKLERELRPGTVVVSHNYRIREWKDRETAYDTVEDPVTGREHTIFVYRR